MWDFRIMKHIEKTPELIIWYGIHEVFHYMDGQLTYTKNPINLAADSPDELKLMHATMLQAFEKDILDYV